MTKRHHSILRRCEMLGAFRLAILSTQYSVLSTAFLLAAAVAQSTTAQESTSNLSRGTLLAPKAFRAAAAKVQPSLVRIEGFGGLAAGVAGGGYQAPGEGPTTGLILSPDGYIVTSTFNFIRKPPVITVVLPSGERRIAKLLGRDETRRICLLKVDGVSDLPVPEFAPRTDLKVGQWAVAIGVGFGGAQPALSTGIISATSRISAKAVQTDANTSPANYGGPLVDLDGRVIGICVPLSPGAKSDAAGSEWYDSGIGFAVSLEGQENIIERLKAGETLKAGFLGVQVEPAGKPAEGKFESGVVIKEIVPDSPAAKAGLEKGDKLISLGGAEIADPTHLISLVGRHLSGDKVEVALKRGEESKTVEATLADAPPPMPMMPPMPAGEAKPKAGEKPMEKPGEE
jgi:serine protease Do